MISKFLRLHNIILAGFLNEKINKCVKQNLILGLESGPLPMASGCIQDLGKVFLSMDLLLANISHNLKKHPVCIFRVVFKCL